MCDVYCTVADQYYNNMKILHVESFRDHPGVWHFVDTVWYDLILKRHVIYRHRRGKSPLRRATANLFPHLYEHTHEFCDIDYHHLSGYWPSCQQSFFDPSRSTAEVFIQIGPGSPFLLELKIAQYKMYGKIVAQRANLAPEQRSGQSCSTTSRFPISRKMTTRLMNYMHIKR